MSFLLLAVLPIWVCVVSQANAPPQSVRVWQTSDKVVSVVIPEGLVELSLQPEELARQPGTTGSRWGDAELGSGVTVLQNSVPKGAKLNDVASGFVNSLGAKVHQTSVEKIGGLTVVSTTAFVSTDDVTAFAKHRVFMTPTTIYQIIGISQGDPEEHDRRIDQFMLSLKLHPPAFSGVSSLANSYRSMTMNEVSGKLGFYGICLLLICGVLSFEKRRAKKKAEAAKSDS